MYYSNTGKGPRLWNRETMPGKLRLIQDDTEKKQRWGWCEQIRVYGVFFFHEQWLLVALFQMITDSGVNFWPAQLTAGFLSKMATSSQVSLLWATMDWVGLSNTAVTCFWTFCCLMKVEKQFSELHAANTKYQDKAENTNTAFQRGSSAISSY